MPPDDSSFRNAQPSSGVYSLSDIELGWPDPATAVFRARLNGPEGAPVWARAWLSTDGGTLAETASPQLIAGETVALVVRLETPEPQPQNAYIRIESSPLQTEHVAALRLTH